MAEFPTLLSTITKLFEHATLVGVETLRNDFVKSGAVQSQFRLIDEEFFYAQTEAKPFILRVTYTGV